LVTGSNAGSIGTFEFSDVENLIGAADNEDTFTFEGAGSLSGIVDGGTGTVVIGGTSEGDFNELTGGGVIRVGGEDSAQRVEIGDASGVTILNQSLVISNSGDGGEVYINGDIVSYGDSGLSIFGSGYTTTIGPGAGNVSGETPVTQDGVTTLSLVGDITISDSVVINGNVVIESTGGKITILDPGTITGNGDSTPDILTLRAPEGGVSIIGEVGGSGLDELIVVANNTSILTTSLESLSISVAMGEINVDETDAISLTNLNTGDGSITVDAGGNITLNGPVTTGGGDVTITGSAAINSTGSGWILTTAGPHSASLVDVIGPDASDISTDLVSIISPDSTLDYSSLFWDDEGRVRVSTYTSFLSPYTVGEDYTFQNDPGGDPSKAPRHTFVTAAPELQNFFSANPVLAD
jgi:hypothetical protein